MHIVNIDQLIFLNRPALEAASSHLCTIQYLTLVLCEVAYLFLIVCDELNSAYLIHV